MKGYRLWAYILAPVYGGMGLARIFAGDYFGFVGIIFGAALLLASNCDEIS